MDHPTTYVVLTALICGNIHNAHMISGQTARVYDPNGPFQVLTNGCIPGQNSETRALSTRNWTLFRPGLGQNAQGVSPGGGTPPGGPMTEHTQTPAQLATHPLTRPVRFL